MFDRRPATDARRAQRLWLPLIVLGLIACDPAPDPSSGLSPAAAAALIDQAPPADIPLADVAEAFALETKATDVQREDLQRALLGHRVEWELPVYEVTRTEGGRYVITSQPIPIQDAGAIALVRVVAIVAVHGPEDEQRLKALKTQDKIRIRGIVQEIRARAVVAVAPAEVADNSTASTQN